MRKTMLYTLTAILLMIFSFGLNTSAPNPVFAQSDLACEGLEETTGDEGCANEGGISIDGTLAFVLNLLSAIAGIIAVMMLIVAGIRYITSQGDPSSTSGAKNAVLYAIIGLVIVALSQIFVRFIIADFDSTLPPSPSQPPIENCPPGENCPR